MTVNTGSYYHTFKHTAILGALSCVNAGVLMTIFTSPHQWSCKWVNYCKRFCEVNSHSLSIMFSIYQRKLAGLVLDVSKPSFSQILLASRGFGKNMDTSSAVWASSTRLNSSQPDAPEYTTINVKLDEGVGIISISRPRALNALNSTVRPWLKDSGIQVLLWLFLSLFELQAVCHNFLSIPG